MCIRDRSWPIPVQRIAIISAPSAAGFGDFMHQLIDNDARLRFAVKLFPAAMQGNSAPASIIAALGEISDQAAVSYTHLDVYKRQRRDALNNSKI